MGSPRLTASEARAAFPAGTVLNDGVTGDDARVVEHTAERASPSCSPSLAAAPRAHTSTRPRKSTSPVTGDVMRAAIVPAERGPETG